MQNSGLIFLILLIVVGVWGIYTYNRFIRKRNLVDEAWSGIDVQLKRRANLIPNLVESVKGYMDHEKETLSELIKLRSGGNDSGSVANRGTQEGRITRSLGKLLAVAENYPELKANSNFLDLQEKLHQTEEDIQYARRYYNGAARDWNMQVESFPSSLIANSFRFTQAEYFELESLDEKAAPKVEFDD